MDRRLSVMVLISCLLVTACASSATSKDSGLGTRTLECVIEEKGQESPSSASGYRSSTGGNYYMVFEAREGHATSRYRLEVTRPQWQRFQEGQHVKITLNNNILVDIRANEE